MRALLLCAAISVRADDPVAYMHDAAGDDFNWAQPLQPDFSLESRGSGVRISCYFANLYRAAPWPKSGGFCFLRNIVASAEHNAILLPDDLRIVPRAPHPADDPEPQNYDAKWSHVLGAKLSTVLANTFADASGMRGGLRFKNVSAGDPELCSLADARPSRRTVLLTPLGDPTSMKHWAVAAFAAFSLHLHLKADYGLPRLTHLLGGSSNRSGVNAWVDFMRAALPPAIGATVLPGNALNEKVTSSKRKEGLRPPRVPAWAQRCFNGVIVGVGGGHSVDPMWLLDRTDTLRLRRTLARHILAVTSTPRTPLRAASPLGASHRASLRTLAQQSMSRAKRAVREADPAALRVLLVNRKRRRIGNAEDIVNALTRDAAAPERRTCAPLSGACDLSWRVASINHTRMEGASAAEQVRTWLDGPNVVIVPHGAGSTHATYLPPCSVVIEVVPNMYPQFSFLVPTMRAGVHMLYLYEASALGNQPLTCLGGKDAGRTRLARADPVMHVHTPMLLQLMHRGAHLRKRCLAHFPDVEYNPHERILQTSLATSAASSHFKHLPRLLGAQEALQFHAVIPTVATGPGVTAARARSAESRAALTAAWPCRTHMNHGVGAPAACLPTPVRSPQVLQAYAAARGGALHPSCAATCGVSAEGRVLRGAVSSAVSEEQCRRCLHANVAREVLAQHSTRPAEPRGYGMELAKRNRCDRASVAIGISKSAKLPPIAPHGVALYRAAVVNRSCLATPTLRPTREEDLPMLFRERLAVLCGLRRDDVSHNLTLRIEPEDPGPPGGGGGAGGLWGRVKSVLGR